MSRHTQYQLLFEEANYNLGIYQLQGRTRPGELITTSVIAQTHLDFSGFNRLPLDKRHAPAEHEHREPL